MLKKIKRFIKKCNNYIDLSSEKVDEISKDIKNLHIEQKNELEKIENKINTINEQVIKIEEQINNLDYKTNCLLANFDCTNLEYLNLNPCITKSKLLIAGFYGAPNLGDELMLLALLNKVSVYKDSLDITIMMSENYSFDITNYPKCRTIHYPKNIMDINTLANYYDTVIFGGGALLDDSDYNLNNKSLSLCTTIINLSYRMITCGKKVIIYGLSSNYELNNKEYIRKLDYTVNNADYFSLRDSNSLNVLNKCGINTNKIKIVHDLVYSLDYYKYSKSDKKDSYIKVGLIYVCNENNYEKLRSLTKAIIKYFNDKELKYQIIMIPFYEYCNNDTHYYNDLIDNLKDEHIKVLEYTSDVNYVFNTISNLDVCVSMRYHGTLISNMFGIPTLNLLYDIHRHYKNKVDYLYTHYGYDNYQVNFSKVDNETFINILDKLCNLPKNKLLNKQVNIEANKQINNVINEFILDKGKVEK